MLFSSRDGRGILHTTVFAMSLRLAATVDRSTNPEGDRGSCQHDQTTRRRREERDIAKAQLMRNAVRIPTLSHAARISCSIETMQKKVKTI